MECGFRGQAIRRHVSTRRGLDPVQYRARWKLPANHPITAPAYSDRRLTAASRRVDAGSGSARPPPRSGGAANRDGTQEVPPKMLTPTQQRAVESFAKSLPTLGDDALIDTYHQAWEDHRNARAEGSDNLGKAGAESLAAKTATQKRFADYQSRYKARYP
jgi:hypothetical protein